jgi:Na+-driven multidrug efflux pump
MNRKDICFDRLNTVRILKLGIPVATQDLLVSISFLVILAIVNSMGVIYSAGLGVAEKLCMFIMLIPSSYMQSMSAFVAQNIGASKPERARKALLCGIGTSLMIGIFMFWLGFFHGDLLCKIFTQDMEIVVQGWDYLKAYAIDTIMTSFLFCFMGYFNGCGRTLFVMVQGLTGAFLIRIPVSYLMSISADPDLFKIGLATPCSTFVQILLCGSVFVYLLHKEKRGKTA